MNKYIYAHTERGFSPAYVNLSQLPNGKLILTVRSEEMEPGKVAPTASIVLEDTIALNLGTEMKAAVSRKCGAA